MRPTRPRFTVRRLMLAVAVAAVILAVVKWHRSRIVSSTMAQDASTGEVFGMTREHADGTIERWDRRTGKVTIEHR